MSWCVVVPRLVRCLSCGNSAVQSQCRFEQHFSTCQSVSAYLSVFAKTEKLLIRNWYNFVRICAPWKWLHFGDIWPWCWGKMVYNLITTGQILMYLYMLMNHTWFCKSNKSGYIWRWFVTGAKIDGLAPVCIPLWHSLTWTFSRNGIYFWEKW